MNNRDEEDEVHVVEVLVLLRRMCDDGADAAL